MRYRLMASYLGASYQAAVGPSDRDVTLFAAPPPPEAHGFSPDPGGIWRKQVELGELDALWESRPIGSYHGEPCLVLDDLGDRLHIVYLGMDERRAAQLGYWEVDRGVFEVVVPRYEVTDLAEERHEFPISLLLSTLPAASPRAIGSGEPSIPGPMPGAGAPMPGPGLPGSGRNGVGMTPQQAAGRANGAIGPGSAVGSPAFPGGAAAFPGGPAFPGGMAAAAGGPGPGGMTGWNAPAGAAQRARGQLPAIGPAPLPAAQPAAAMSAPVAPAGPQQPGPGAYYPMAGATQNGGGLPAPPGFPSAPMGTQPPGPQLPSGQQLPAGSQRAGFAEGVPGGQIAMAAPGQGMWGGQGTQTASGAAPLPTPTMQLPGGQLPMAQQPAPQQHLAQQQPGPQQPGPQQQQPAPQQQQPAPQQQAPQQQAPQQPPAQQFALPPAQPAAPQAADPAQPVPVAQGTGPQVAIPQAPTTVAAWHGSPAIDGNGNGSWYFQPGPAQAMPPVSPNGFGGVQQYAQPAQPVPATGYQQAPPSPPATAARQPLAGQPQAVPQPQPGPAAQPFQPAQAMQGPQFAAPLAPAAPLLPQAVPAPESATPAATLGVPAELALPGATATGGTAAPAAGLATAQAPAEPLGVPAVSPGLVAAPPGAQADPVTDPFPVAPPVLAPPPVTPLQQVASPPVAAQPVAAQPLSAPLPTTAAPEPEASATGPLTPAPPTSQSDRPPSSGRSSAGPLSKLTGAVRGRRAARKPRLSMSAIFADLVDMADIPRSAYAVDEEITGSMCLFKTDGGYEVFSCGEDARHEVRFFEEEESAYFYLFGVLAAEALRNGRLNPRRG